MERDPLERGPDVTSEYRAVSFLNSVAKNVGRLAAADAASWSNPFICPRTYFIPVA